MLLLSRVYLVEFHTEDARLGPAHPSNDSKGLVSTRHPHGEIDHGPFLDSRQALDGAASQGEVDQGPSALCLSPFKVKGDLEFRHDAWKLACFFSASIGEVFWSTALFHFSLTLGEGEIIPKNTIPKRPLWSKELYVFEWAARVSAAGCAPSRRVKGGEFGYRR